MIAARVVLLCVLRVVVYITNARRSTTPYQPTPIQQLPRLSYVLDVQDDSGGRGTSDVTIKEPRFPDPLLGFWWRLLVDPGYCRGRGGMSVAMKAVTLSPVCELVSNECASVGIWGAVCKGRNGNEKERDGMDLHFCGPCVVG